MYKLEGTESYEMLVKWLISLKEQFLNKTGISLADKFSVLDHIIVGGKAQTKIRTAVPKIYDSDMATSYPNFVWESPRVNRILYEIQNNDLTAEQIAAGDRQRKLQAFFMMQNWQW